MKVDENGRGVINILSAEKLVQSPALYSTFLLWLLSELFEQLPEAGDLDKPKLVFFFDEAHLLFSDAPQALTDKVEQVVRLIRSKGVGVFFVTQNPLDVPEKILGQLGNRVQHALRAFTPRDQKAVQSAAQTMRANPKFDAAAVITELGVGEALVSFLDEKGRPNVVERSMIFPPASRLGPLTADERKAVIPASPFHAIYDQTVDRESAYENLRGKPAAAQPAPGAIPPRRPGRAAATPMIGATTPASGAAAPCPATKAKRPGPAGQPPAAASSTASATCSAAPPARAAATAKACSRPPPRAPPAAWPARRRHSYPPAGSGGPDVNDWGNHAGQQAQPRPVPQPRQSAPAPQESGGGILDGLGDLLGGSTGPRGGHREGVIEAAAKSAARGMASSVGRGLGNQILRGVLGSILGGRR